MPEPAMASHLTAVLKPDVNLRRADTGIWSTLPVEDEAADYDQIAGGYDLLIGNPIYNRIVWGCTTDRYTDTARRTLAQNGAGPALDAGCGSLVFTAKAYGSTPRERLVLLDRSMGMLQRGQRRLPDGQFLQGDCLALPFKNDAFDTVMAWGMLHIFGSDSRFLAELERVAAPGARIALSTLVLSDRALGNHVLGMLHRRGEVVTPEPASLVAQAFAERFDAEPHRLIGNMLFLSGQKRATSLVR